MSHLPLEGSSQKHWEAPNNDIIFGINNIIESTTQDIDTDTVYTSRSTGYSIDYEQSNGTIALTYILLMSTAPKFAKSERTIVPTINYMPPSIPSSDDNNT